jgi:N-acetylglucosaminyl-diphospho-decaprenol L-rhamnosyltransferase
VRACVVIPTLNARDLLKRALESLAEQTARVRIVVVDNASSDGTGEMVAQRFPDVKIVVNERNLGFGRAINRGFDHVGDADVVILINTDTVCEPEFVEHMLAPFADPSVGMVAGVLLQGSAPELVDSAGIEIDATLRSWDIGWNEPLAELDAAAPPVGPCGGAAAYRIEALRAEGGGCFDDAFFAYWEDVDLALRLRLAGWRCVRADGARALHAHGATLGAASPAQRRLEAFGRAYVLHKYRVPSLGLWTRAKIAVLDWPVLLVHLVLRRELGPVRARARGARDGRLAPGLRPPVELATVGLGEALRRQYGLILLRLTGRLPAHFREHAPATATGTRATPPSDRG